MPASGANGEAESAAGDFLVECCQWPVKPATQDAESAAPSPLAPLGGKSAPAPPVASRGAAAQNGAMEELMVLIGYLVLPLFAFLGMVYLVVRIAIRRSRTDR